MGEIGVAAKKKNRRIQKIVGPKKIIQKIKNQIPDVDFEHLEDFQFEIQSSKSDLITLLVPDHALVHYRDAFLDWAQAMGDFRLKTIVLTRKYEEDNGQGGILEPQYSDLIYLSIPRSVSVDILADVLRNAMHTLKLANHNIELEKNLQGVYTDVRSLTKVGQALLTERDFDKLIGLILEQARLLIGTDGGSIYITEPPEKKGEKSTKLRFKKSALNLDADEFLLDINENSIAGYVAMTGEPLIIDDVYKLSGREEYHFNSEFDRVHQYYTKSMMLIPMKNHRNDVIGVIQLINKKSDPNAELTLKQMKGSGVIPFTSKCYEIVSSLAGQAGMAIENNTLISEIKDLFEGFVRASVKAIEQRDPTTSGHSSRVATYSEGMAKAIDHIGAGDFRAIKFSKEQITELRYASLLHDFGKVGVREEVLVKARKLYPHQLDVIKWRFQYIQKSLDAEALEKKLDLIQKGGAPNDPGLELIEAEYKEKKKSVANMYASILQANEPTILEAGDFKKLEQMTSKSVLLDDGCRVPFLEQSELLSLSIKKGTLGATERAEIESHVSHTYQFLIQIPWTKDLCNVPDIAHGHHEKLDGSGYPLGLGEQEIAIQTRIMTIADIFDALTAWDRPYKKAVPIEDALDILHMEAKDHHVDPRVLKIFIESGVYKTARTSVHL